MASVRITIGIFRWEMRYTVNQPETSILVKCQVTFSMTMTQSYTSIGLLIIVKRIEKILQTKKEKRKNTKWKLYYHWNAKSVLV